MAEESPKAEPQSLKEGVMECSSRSGKNILFRRISFLCNLVGYFSHYLSDQLHNSSYLLMRFSLDHF